MRSQCNGTVSPKRRCENVLSLTGEDGRDEGAAPLHVCLEDGGDLENLDRSILQFTVGGDDRTEILLPVISPNSETADVDSSPGRRLSSQDNTTQTSPSEPSEYISRGNFHFTHSFVFVCKVILMPQGDL